MKLMPKQPQKYIGLPLTQRSIIRFDQGCGTRWTLAPATAPMEVFRQLRLRLRQKLAGSDDFGSGSGSGEPEPEPGDFGPAIALCQWIPKSYGSCFHENVLAPMAPAPAPAPGGIGGIRQHSSAMVVCHEDAHPVLGIMGRCPDVTSMTQVGLFSDPAQCPGIDPGSQAQKADKLPAAPVWLLPAPGRWSRDNFRPTLVVYLCIPSGSGSGLNILAPIPPAATHRLRF